MLITIYLTPSCFSLENDSTAVATRVVTAVAEGAGTTTTADMVVVVVAVMVALITEAEGTPPIMVVMEEGTTAITTVITAEGVTTMGEESETTSGEFGTACELGIFIFILALFLHYSY